MGLCWIYLGARPPEWGSGQAFLKAPAARADYKPSRLVTDGLRSYGVAHRGILPDVRLIQMGEDTLATLEISR